MNKTALGEKLRNLRQDNGLTQDELASRASVALRALQRVETGEGNPTLDTLEAISGVLGVTISALIEEIPPELAEGPRLPGTRDFLSVAGFLSKLAAAPPDIQRYVYAVVTKNPEYLRAASKDFRQKAIAFLKGVLAL